MGVEKDVLQISYKNNFDSTDILILRTILSIKERRQRSDNVSILHYIKKSSASNFTEEVIVERLGTLINDEKDSIFLTEEL